MKKFYFILTAFVVTMGNSANAQLVNMSPDPNGPVWASGDMLSTQLSADCDIIKKSGISLVTKPRNNLV